MKFKLASLTLALLLTPFVAANALAHPTACPGIVAVKAVGMQDAIKQENLWIAFSTDYFSTQQEWTFAIASRGKDKNEAIRIGNGNLNRLYNEAGPYQQSDDSWYCYYDGEENVFALAVTPPRKNIAFFKYFPRKG